MIEHIYLQPSEQMPQMTDEDAWLIIEASDDGRFFGTGYGFKASGEGVFYVSLPESDTTLKAALAAATDWAEDRGVSRICVQTSPVL
ncbi:MULTISPECIES: hypothetical protein [unclassified Sphingomonas]|uniref:hypothetical protein n=1 Tax=unclassified Sphingomonas TaxID=196159 RepID=UPI0008320647|nr:MULTISPECIES: hypothetical protein [unclassified Sphingomonas]